MDVDSVVARFYDDPGVLLAQIMFLGLTCVPLGLYVTCGNQQRREAGGSWLALVAVSIVGMSLAALPVILGTLAYMALGDNQSLLPGFSCLLSIVAWFGFIPYLRPPHTYGEQALPLVDDLDIHKRVCELATQMKVRVPRIRLLRSANTHQSAAACAGGLPCQSLVVSDGLLYRLERREQETILAHELAHLANHSLWILATVLPLACSLAVLALVFQVHTWFLVAPAVFVGLHRIISRQLEYDCDLRAARAVGFPELATALTKIHKIDLMYRMTLALRLMYGTTGHPALCNRLDSLRQHSPPALRPQMPAINDSTRFNSQLAWLMATLWLMTLALACWLGTSEQIEVQIISASLLLLITITPRLIRFIAVSQRGTPLSFILRTPFEMMLLVVAFSLVFVGCGVFYSMGSLSDSIVWWILAAGCVVSGLVLLDRYQSRLNKRKEFDSAWKRLDFEAVIRISSGTPQWLLHDVYRRGLVATAKAAQGHFDEAIIDFEQLDREGLINDHGLLWLTVIQCEARLFEEALQSASRYLELTRESGTGEALKSRIFRRMGKLDAAREQITRALELQPLEGAIWAAAAGIEIDAGNVSRAREFLTRAQELSPGTPQELAEAARLAAQTESPDIAREKLQRAISAYQANPLMLRPSEIQALTSVLANLRPNP